MARRSSSVGAPLPDLLAPGILLVAGVALMIGGWIGASGRAVLDEQILFINLSVGGLVLIGAACGTYLQSMRRQVSERAGLVAGAALHHFDAGVDEDV